MRYSLTLLKATANAAAKRWKPRPLNMPDPTLNLERGPELFNQRIVLTDGSSFTLRSTSPRPQIKLSKDTRSHQLWNPQAVIDIQDEGGYLGSFQRRFGNIDTVGDFQFDDDAEVAKQQKGTNDMMVKKKKHQKK
ncbi:hypothetical protein H4219_001080 [Mycoemilia scoparia]|uniref:Ribosomal protein bL31m N-terminal domain-containing protein n=1 Tax=Mycoemilia scoparia TaxID=417184 RepID=A0A9W8A4D3_9FUNG|nr:hypothetical protein H4219_001080 [Mycoemilia scoparia]